MAHVDTRWRAPLSIRSSHTGTCNEPKMRRGSVPVIVSTAPSADGEPSGSGGGGSNGGGGVGGGHGGGCAGDDAAGGEEQSEKALHEDQALDAKAPLEEKDAAMAALLQEEIESAR